MNLQPVKSAIGIPGLTVNIVCLNYPLQKTVQLTTAPSIEKRLFGVEGERKTSQNVVISRTW